MSVKPLAPRPVERKWRSNSVYYLTLGVVFVPCYAVILFWLVEPVTRWIEATGRQPTHLESLVGAIIALFIVAYFIDLAIAIILSAFVSGLMGVWNYQVFDKAMHRTGWYDYEHPNRHHATSRQN